MVYGTNHGDCGVIQKHMLEIKLVDTLSTVPTTAPKRTKCTESMIVNAMIYTTLHHHNGQVHQHACSYNARIQNTAANSAEKINKVRGVAMIGVIKTPVLRPADGGQATSTPQTSHIRLCFGPQTPPSPNATAALQHSTYQPRTDMATKATYCPCKQQLKTTQPL